MSAHDRTAADENRTTIPSVRPGREYFVAPDGSDRADGSADRPFATLERARDEVRAAMSGGPPRGGVAVTLKPGIYPRTATFALGSVDSGTPDSPVVYRAERPGTAMLYGGARLERFTLVEDAAILARLPEQARGKVYQCDLTAHGITDFGSLAVRGCGQPPSPPTLELYCDGKPMTLARWPNEGFVEIGRLVEPGEKGVRPSVFEYVSDRHARWTNAPDGWLFGYFRWLWADSTLPIGSIDPAAKTVTTAEAYDYHGGMDTTQGIIYYAFNLLEELDVPGEWYLDRRTGVLYFWPPTDPAGARIEMGVLGSPMVTIDDARHVRVEGIAFDLGRDTCMAIRECTSCLVAGCTVTRFAGNGICLHGGYDCGIYGCDISMLGRRGTEVIGGDRTTLEPARHFVENCRIYDFGRIDRTYTPAIQLEGVGNRVSHNLLYDCPSSVMRIEGNDHLIEYNETHSAVRESDDQGAMELFYNPTYRGVVFRYNLFHNNGKTGSETAFHGQAAIRLDDAISGVLIHGNVFVRSANGNFGAVQINSGRDNVIENNLFSNCRCCVSGGWRRENTVWQTIRAGNPRPDIYHESQRYLERYPEIARMMEEPGINTLRCNVVHRCGPLITRNPELFDLVDNHDLGDTDPGFVDEHRADYRLEPGAPALAVPCFTPLPVEVMGLYEHPLRASWPVHADPVKLPDWR